MLGGLSRRWSAWREGRALARHAIDDALWDWTLLRYAFLRELTVEEQGQLRRLCSLFLAGKEFHGAQGFTVTDEVAAAVAAQACLPVLHLGLRPYDGFVGIVLHADEVSVEREYEDDAGVVHRYTDSLAGEAMEGGPVMLTWQALLDAEEEGAQEQQPYNVVIHEFAHVLDMREGLSARLPGLAEAYAAFCGEVDAGATDTLIDPYGSESIEEFFAVACEAFFVAGGAMRREYPALYDSLRRYFRQDTALRGSD